VPAVSVSSGSLLEAAGRLRDDLVELRRRLHRRPEIVNDAGLTETVLEAATALLGGDRVHRMPTPIMPAEDFSEVLRRVPGTMTFLGARPEEPGPAASVHANRMILDESALPVGAALHATVALRLPRNPGPRS
jgi:metal-dependent amidase/aminoacylase/carboxypeptidase family protein